jgi:hypothetical protein
LVWICYNGLIIEKDEKMSYYRLIRIAKDQPETSLDLGPEDLDIIVDALYDAADINGSQKAEELMASLLRLAK